MHADTVEVDEDVFTAFHHGDWSGDIEITRTDSSGLVKTMGPGDVTRVVLPFELLEELVGRMMIDKKTVLLEQLTGREYVRGS
jgi:hypothetical protein